MTTMAESVPALPPIEAVDALEPERVPAFVLHLSALLARAASRMAETATARPRLISVHEAAGRAGLSPDFFYDHKTTLPFVRHKGRRVLVDETGLERWLRRR